MHLQRRLGASVVDWICFGGQRWMMERRPGGNSGSGGALGNAWTTREFGVATSAGKEAPVCTTSNPSTAKSSRFLDHDTTSITRNPRRQRFYSIRASLDFRHVSGRLVVTAGASAEAPRSIPVFSSHFSLTMDVDMSFPRRRSSGHILKLQEYTSDNSPEDWRY